jgi:hypothetical protein
VFFASSLGRAVKFSDVRELIGSDTEKIADKWENTILRMYETVTKR